MSEKFKLSLVSNSAMNKKVPKKVLMLSMRSSQKLPKMSRSQQQERERAKARVKPQARTARRKHLPSSQKITNGQCLTGNLRIFHKFSWA